LTSEQLVEVEGETSGGFDAIAELERINRELGELEIHESLRRQEDDENKENIDHSIPRRRVTVEEVEDEDDLGRVAGEEMGVEGVGLAISSSPPLDPKETKEPLVSLDWTGEAKPGNKAGSSRRTTTPQSLFSELLESKTEVTKEEGKPPGGSNASDSWSFDELFRAFPTEKGKAKEKVGESSNGLFLLPCADACG
jgi:hypothetical protein